jgi:hypothetical protein
VVVIVADEYAEMGHLLIVEVNEQDLIDCARIVSEDENQ